MFNQKQLYKILEFPKHLQVSLTSLLKLSLASADQVAAVTGKARAIESSYLNQLVVMHIVPGASGSNGFFQCCFGGFGLVKGKPWTVEDEKLL